VRDLPVPAAGQMNKNGSKTVTKGWKTKKKK
jgi:hypothetical protein